jgi:hypothetical protein
MTILTEPGKSAKAGFHHTISGLASKREEGILSSTRSVTHRILYVDMLAEASKSWGEEETESTQPNS